MILLGA